MNYSQQCAKALADAAAPDDTLRLVYNDAVEADPANPPSLRDINQAVGRGAPCYFEVAHYNAREDTPRYLSALLASPHHNSITRAYARVLELFGGRGKAVAAFIRTNDDKRENLVLHGLTKRRLRHDPETLTAFKLIDSRGGVEPVIVERRSTFVTLVTSIGDWCNNPRPFVAPPDEDDFMDPRNYPVAERPARAEKLLRSLGRRPGYEKALRIMTPDQLVDYAIEAWIKYKEKECQRFSSPTCTQQVATT